MQSGPCSEVKPLKVVSGGYLFLNEKRLRLVAILQNLNKCHEEITDAFTKLLDVGVLIGRAFITVNGNSLVYDLTHPVFLLPQRFHHQLLKVAGKELKTVLIGQNDHILGTFTVTGSKPSQGEQGGGV